MAKPINDRYRVLDEIGSGGMGTVYKGLDLQTDHIVAIKHLNPNLINAELLERFRREGQMLRELNHPNIVKMLDAVEEYGNHYLIMEYVSGADLLTILDETKLPVERILRTAIDLADALTRAHRLDIIHRDLKPANVLIGEDGVLKLTDFGLAYISEKERVTQENVIIGTVNYLAPEVITGDIIDARTDIWAFGIMLFEMLTGKRPFDGETTVQIIRNIITRPHPAIEDLVDGVPDVLIDLVNWMLEKDHKSRIRSIRLIGAELETILQSGDASRFTRLTSNITPARNNLPLPTAPFIGRKNELLELANLVENPDVRLITVLAPGGMGKTHLVLELARRIVGRKTRPLFPNGVYFIELAHLTDADNIVMAVANALSFDFSTQERPQAQILKYLSNKNVLLIFDNYEHLLSGAEFVDKILQTAPNVRVIVTSRERLNLLGEQTFALGGLDTGGRLLDSAAAQLFIQNARRIKPDFELEGDDDHHLAKICQLVDGMPLAIILSAVWIEFLTLKEIAHELTQGLSILETDMRNIPERQHSVQMIFDYSWQRLSSDEQSVFAKMSVFRGGMTRQSAQAVTGTNLRTLQALANKGLIRRNPDTGRYHIHELARQYAAQWLHRMGDTEETDDAHMSYYADFLQQRQLDLVGRNQIQGLADIEADFENIRNAWMRAANHCQFHLTDKMSFALGLYCNWKNRLEGHRLFSLVLPKLPPQTTDEDERRWGRMILYGATLSTHMPLQEQRAIYEQSLAIARKHKDEADMATCLYLLAFPIGSQDGPDAALDLLNQALGLYQLSDNPFGVAHAYHMLGFWAIQKNAIIDAERYIRQAVEIRRSIKDFYGLIISTNNLADLLFNSKGYFDEAESMYRDLVERARALALPNAYCLAQGNLAFQSCLIGRGDLEEARTIAYELSDLATDIANPDYIAMSLAILGLLDAIEGMYAIGKRKCLDGRELLRTSPDPSILRDVNFGLMLAYCGLGQYEQVQHLFFEQDFLMRRPLHAMPCVAVLLAEKGEFKRAAQLLGLTFTSPLSPKGWLRQWHFLNNFRDDLHAKLGESTFNDAWEQGKKLDINTLIPQLLDEFRYN